MNEHWKAAAAMSSMSAWFMGIGKKDLTMKCWHCKEEYGSQVHLDGVWEAILCIRCHNLWDGLCMEYAPGGREMPEPDGPGEAFFDYQTLGAEVQRLMHAGADVEDKRLYQAMKDYHEARRAFRVAAKQFAPMPEAEASESPKEELWRAVPPPEKLELLADWIDAKYPNDAAPEVQVDLRAWAAAIRRCKSFIPEGVLSAIEDMTEK